MGKTPLFARSRNGNGRNGHGRNGNGVAKNGNGHGKNGNGSGRNGNGRSLTAAEQAAQGYARLKTELTKLLDSERPELVKTISWAASNGDRSENGDYIYGKKRLREIDRRIH